jgi:hypothetical protein
MCPRRGRRLPTPRCTFYRSFGQQHIAHVTISRLESSGGRSRDAAGAQKKKMAGSLPARSSRHSMLKSRSSALSVSILLSLIRAEIWEP